MLDVFNVASKIHAVIVVNIFFLTPQTQLNNY